MSRSDHASVFTCLYFLCIFFADILNQIFSLFKWLGPSPPAITMPENEPQAIARKVSDPIDVPIGRNGLALGRQHEDIASIVTGMQMFGLSAPNEMIRSVVILINLKQLLLF